MGRKFKFVKKDGTELSPNKLKKYIRGADGTLREASTAEVEAAALTELVFSGSKSDIRKGEMSERNVTVLHNKVLEVETSVGTEETRATAAEGVLTASISTEESARTSAINSTNATLAAETTARTNEDTALGGRLTTLENAPTVAPMTSSTIAPTSPTVGDTWFRTDTSVLYMYVNDGDSLQWIDISTDTLMADYVPYATYTPAQAAQDVLISNLLAANTTNIASIATNTTNIATETTRATAAEGTNATDISNLQSSKATVFNQNTAPSTGFSAGDIWVDTDDAIVSIAGNIAGSLEWIGV